MSTRASARNLFPPLDKPELTIRRRYRVDPTLLNDFEMATEGNGDPPVPDLRTMEELCQPTMNGRGGPITLIAIQATNFGLKNDMIQQVQNSCQFHGLSGDDASKHLDKFLHVTQNTFYNGLTLRHRDTINVAPGGTFIKRRLEECYDLIENMTAHHNDWDTSAQQIESFSSITSSSDLKLIALKAEIKFFRLTNKSKQLLITVKLVMNTASSSGSGTLPSNTITYPKEDLKGITTRSGTVYKGPTIPTTPSSPHEVGERETEVIKDTVLPTNNESTKDVQPLVVQIETPIPHSEPVVAPVAEPVVAPVSASKPNQKPSIPYPSRLPDQKLRDKANDQREKFFQIFQDLNFNISFADALILMPTFGSTIKILLTNKDKLFELAKTPLNEHCSAVLLKKLPKKLGDPGKFLIPCDFLRMDECLALVDLGATINLMPLSMWNNLFLPELTPTLMTLELEDRSISRTISVAEDVFVKVGKFYFPADFVVVDFDANPRVPLILRRSFLKIGRALINVYAGELTLRVNNEAVTLNLDQTSRYSANYNDMMANRIDVIDMASFLNNDPSLPHSTQGMYLPQNRKELKICKAKNDKSSMDELLEVELKNLPPHPEYAFLEGDDKLPVIIAKDLSVEEKILIEDDFKQVVQHQRRVNPKIHDVIKKEVEKLLDAGLIYSISDSPWVWKLQKSREKNQKLDNNRHKNGKKASPIIVEPLRIELPFLEDQSQEDPPPEVPMADNRTMAELLQAPTEGYEDAIVIPEITANNFELKHGLINLVQNKPFFGRDKEDPHVHIRYFNKITSTMRVPNVPSSSIKLILFPFSLEGASRIWLEKEAPRSIQTWDDLVSKFINQFFPPLKMTNLLNEITRFQQRFDESFHEAWERFNDLLRACPYHGFFELHQLDTLYNALNINDKDSLNSAAAPTPSTTPALVKAIEPNCVTCGGAHSYQNCPSTYENAYRDSIQEYVSQAATASYNQGNIGFRPQMVANQIRPPGFPPHQNNQNNFNRGNNFNQNRGGNFNQSNFNPSSFNQGQLHRPQVNQAPVYQAPIPQTQRVSQIDFKSYVKANDEILRNMQSQGQSTQNQCQNIQNQNQNLQIQMATLTDMMSKLVSSNTASSSGSGALPGTKVTKDQVQTPISQNTAPIQPSVIQSKSQALVSEPVVAPVGAPMPNLKPSIPYPSRRDNEKRRDQANEQVEKFYEIFKDMSFEISFMDALTLMPKFASTLKALIGNTEKLNEMARTLMNEHCSAFPADFVVVDFEPDPRVPLILGRCFLKTGRALIDVHKGELTLHIRKEAITYNLDQTVRYPANYDQMTANKIDVICEIYSQEVLSFSDVTASDSPTPDDDPIVSTTSPTLTPFRDSDFLLFEEADAFLGLEDDPDLPKINPFYYDPEGDILLLETILNSKPLSPLPNHEQYLPSYKKELKVCEAKTIKSSVDEPPEVELKDLPHHLEYAFLEGDNKLPVIIAKELKDEEKSALIKVLKSHKRAIAWKLSDIQGTNPEFCTHKILMEEDYKPAVQQQRRVNPKIHDVIKKEVEKLLDAGLIYPISDSLWASPVHCVPKKGGFTMVENEENELIPTRFVTEWRVCIDYRKLNEATQKDPFPLPFMDQMLERLAGNKYYCFLDGFFEYFQIPIDPRDQEKTTFTCTYGTFAYRRMPFGLCNAPSTFQRCMLAIFHNMVEKTMEVFMDD
nr:reverse transcriptase domain-containing protein [Tanacetum cinerariifolium]